jgi:hypothetical protein
LAARIDLNMAARTGAFSTATRLPPFDKASCG